MEQTNYVACRVRRASLRSDRDLAHLAVTAASSGPYNLTENKADKSRTIYLQITNTQRKCTGRYASFSIISKKSEVALRMADPYLRQI